MLSVASTAAACCAEASGPGPRRPPPGDPHYNAGVRVDQVIPTLAWPDAIGSHTLALSDALRAAGVDSDIYYGHCPTPSLAGRAHPLGELGRPDRGRVLLYQASIGSPVFDHLVTRPETKLVNYHNITPADLVERWEPAVAYELHLGRAQLPRLAPSCRLAIGVSSYNEEELRAAGYRHTAVVPLLFDAEREDVEPDPALTARLSTLKSRGGADLLFVGKLSPHKAPHDLVKALAVYRRLYDPKARLHLVGSPLGNTYMDAMLDFVAALGLEEAVELSGMVTASELEAYYRCADVFVSASEHEGFCAPLVEAMARGVPVVAYGAGAVPETVAEAGVVLDSKEPLVLAAAVARVRGDRALAVSLRRAGVARAARFSIGRSKAAMVSTITSLAQAEVA
jgi:glycosyltransferase involved in cell wall biosynthesis